MKKIKLDIPFRRSLLQRPQSLLVIFTDQVLLDPTFCGIFVCGPLQSFVVNVCTLILSMRDEWTAVNQELRLFIRNILSNRTMTFSMRFEEFGRS